MARSSNRFFDCFRTETVESSKDDVSASSPPDAAHHGKLVSDQKTPRSLRRLAKAFISHAASVRKNRRKKSNKLNNSYSSMYNELLSKDPQSANDSRVIDPKSSSTFTIHSSSLNSRSSTSSMPLCSSSGSSVISTTSMRRDEFLDYKPTKQPWYRRFLSGKNRSDLNFAMCLFLFCLLILTCWGKTCAIICTSTLLVLIPSRVRRVNSLGHSQLRLRQIDLKEHKKAVIMEGLLSRNRYYNVYS